MSRSSASVAATWCRSPSSSRARHSSRPGPAHDVVVALGAVEVEADDRAELRVRGAKEGQPVGLRTRHRVLVAPDAIAPRLEQHARDHALDRRRVRVAGGRVPVVVDGRLRPPLEDSIGGPRCQRLRGGGVRIGLRAELEPNGVVRIASQERAAHLLVDDVVRRAHDVGDVGEPGRRGVVVVGQPHAIGHGRPAESIDGVVQPAEGRDARHSRARIVAIPPVRPSRPPGRPRPVPGPLPAGRARPAPGAHALHRSADRHSRAPRSHSAAGDGGPPS